MGSVVADEGPTTYLLVFILFFRWDFSDPFDVCLGYPVLRYPIVLISTIIMDTITKPYHTVVFTYKATPIRWFSHTKQHPTSIIVR